jgi:hypothetical protein
VVKGAFGLWGTPHPPESEEKSEEKPKEKSKKNLG